MIINTIERQCLINRVIPIDSKMDFTKSKQPTYVKSNNKKDNVSFQSILENELRKFNK